MRYGKLCNYKNVQKYFKLTMLNVLEIGSIAFARNDIVRQQMLASRRLEYGKYLDSFTLLLLFAHDSFRLKREKEAKNIEVYYTSRNKILGAIQAIYLGLMLCKKKKISVISSQDPYFSGLVGIICKILRNIPFSSQLHADTIDNYYPGMSIKSKINNFIGKIVLKRADSVRVVSERLKNKMIALGIPESRIKVIPTPVDYSLLTPRNKDLLAERLFRNTFKKMVLFVGRLVPEKNVPLLLEGFTIVVKQKKDVLLTIVGDGPEKTKLENLAVSLGVDKNVLFAGSVPHGELADYYSLSDIFVLPSLCEGRGTVLAEAIICKKPVISCDVGDARMLIVDNKSGFIIANDHHQLADKILFLLDHSHIAKQFGEFGHSMFMQNKGNNTGVEAIIHFWQDTAALNRSCN